MNKKFLRLSKEKQEKILEAAISEFAYVGYDRASTDNIVIKAGISKGSLFNYFINKQGLYEDIIEYAMTKEQKEVMEALKEIKTGDFYDRLKQLLTIKYGYISNNVLEAKMLRDYISNNNEQNNEKVRHYKAVENEYLQKYLITYLDLEAIRPEVSVEDVIFVTNTLLQAVLKRQDELACFDKKASEITVIQKELDKYIDLLKYGIYKRD